MQAGLKLALIDQTAGLVNDDEGEDGPRVGQLRARGSFGGGGAHDAGDEEC